MPLLEQENRGQASAINAALPHVRGEFLVWPDSDDWMTPDSIEKRVCFLQEHPEAVLVRANMMKIDEKTLRPLGVFENDSSCKPRIMEHYLHQLIMNQTWGAAGSVMARTSVLMEMLPGKRIYATKTSGQNWQLLVPLASRGECWQMPETLNFYLVRQNSHSHAAVNIEEKLRYIDMSEDVLLNILKTYPELNATYRDKLIIKYEWERFNEARKLRDKKSMRKSYTKLKSLGIPTSLLIRAFLIAYVTPFNGKLLYRKIRKMYAH